MDTIADLLPNEHILNFYDSNPASTTAASQLPEWLLLKPTLSLMMGAGDLCHGGITNIEKFNMFDVFLCNAMDHDGSVRKNLLYLLANHHHQKVICIMNIHNQEHVRKFVQLFKGRFHHIDGHLNHTPHLPYENLNQVLSVGGTATNIYESSENMVSTDEILFWLESGFFKTGGGKVMATSRVYSKNMGYTLLEQDEAMLRQKFISKIQEMAPSAKQVTVSPLITLEELELRQLQIIQYCLSISIDLMLNLVAEVKHNVRLWSPQSRVELVITKVQPDLMEEKVALCRDEELRAHLNRLIAGIKTDLENGFALGSTAKYRNLKKYVASEKFEAACAPL